MLYITKGPAGAPAERQEDEIINLATLQHYCEGLVTCPYIPELNEQGITLWANDEGLCLSMAPNLGFLVNGYPMVIVGPIMFTSSNDEGDTTGLCEKQAEFVEGFCERGSQNLSAVLLRSALGL
jgi:hypothetical protein